MIKLRQINLQSIGLNFIHSIIHTFVFCTDSTFHLQINFMLTSITLSLLQLCPASSVNFIQLLSATSQFQEFGESRGVFHYQILKLPVSRDIEHSVELDRCFPVKSQHFD